MKTLLIYDNDGKVFFNMTGNTSSLSIPNGLQHIILEIPEGKRIAHTEFQVDFSKGYPVVLLEDIPKTEIEILQEQLEMAESALNYILMG